MRYTALLAMATAITAFASEDLTFDKALHARVPTLRAVVPAITESAEAAAARHDANPHANLRISRVDCAGLNEELMARAGGLSQVGYWRPGPDDVQLLAVRDWESFGQRAVWLVKHWHDRGNIVVVFGSAAGKPYDLNADFLIDNGAPDGSSEYASVNTAANVTLAWMWCCEYCSAFSRKGKFPAITKGIISASSQNHNDGTKAPDWGIRFYKCDTPIAAGDLAIAYLGRVAKLIADVREPPVANSISHSAEIIADRLAAGRRVAVAGLGHMILEEPKHGLKSPMIGFRGVSLLPYSFPFTIEKGDLLVWITYSGMNSGWDDYGYAIRRSEADIIASFAETPRPSPTDDFLEFIPQPWDSPDAEVAIPVPPYAMAPVSAIARILILRMLDEEVASVLSERGLDIPRPEIARPDAFHDFGQHSRTPLTDAWYIPDPDDRWGLLDTNGCVVVAAVSETAPRFLRGHKVQILANGTNTVFDLDAGTSTNTPAPPRAAPPKPAPVAQRSTNYGGLRLVCTNGLWGAIGKDGKFRLEPRYDNLLRANGGRLITQIGERYGMVAGDGREIVPTVYDTISQNGEFITVSSNLSYRILALDGSRFLNEIRYKHPPVPIGGGKVKVRVDGKMGLYTLEGEEVIPPVNDSIGTVTPDYAIVRNGTRWSLLPRSTNAPAIKGDFAKIEREPFGGFRVEEGRLFGLLAADGSQLAPIAYEPISRGRDAKRGERIVRRDGELLILSDDGKTRPFPYPCDHADYFLRGTPKPRKGETEPPKWENHYRVAKDGKWGMVDHEGKVLLPLEYSYVSPCDANGHAYVATGGVWRLDANPRPILYGAKWGACDVSGKILVPPDFDGLEYYNDFWTYIVRKRHTVVTP